MFRVFLWRIKMLDVFFGVREDVRGHPPQFCPSLAFVFLQVDVVGSPKVIC